MNSRKQIKTRFRGWAVCLLVWTTACQPGSGASHTAETSRSLSAPQRQASLRLNRPDEPMALGDSFWVSATLPSLPVETLRFTLNDRPVEPLQQDSLSFLLPSHLGRIGDNPLILRVAFTDSSQASANLTVTLLSDTAPARLTYSVVGEYAHDRTLFTQGLVYEDGLLYEGTGLREASQIRCYRPGENQVLRQQYLDPAYFGEGITLMGNTLYQLTYLSQRLLLYDKSNFRLLQTVPFPHEGWGLTDNDTLLIASDGSSHLYFLDPKTLAEIKRIQVADDRQLISRLNELEYVNGYVFANVYQSDTIVCVDPANGKVISYAHMRGILPGYESDQGKDHVLNGIAYRPDQHTFFLTGKRWPRLFEVVFSGPPL